MSTVYHYDIDGVFVGSSDALESPLEPGVYLCPAGATFVAPPSIPSGKQAVFNDGAWALRNLPTPEEQDAQEQAPGDSLAQLRLIRTERLQQVDGVLQDMFWDQVQGNPWVDETVQAWATYRQALKDLPNQYQNQDFNIQDVEWPVAPTARG
jgi:hypothetical protein